MAGDVRSLLLLTAFAKAVSHKIRTPLSVVSNELSFLASEHPELSTVPAQRVKDIAEILKLSTRLGSGVLRESSVSTAAVLASFPRCEGLEYLILGDIGLLTSAYKLLFELFGTVGQSGPSLTVRVKPLENRQIEISIAGNWAESPPEGRWSTVTEFVNIGLGLDSISTPLIDVVLIGHGSDVSVVSSAGSVSVTATFPPG